MEQFLKANLIPRNNWDYGVGDLIKALLSCCKGIDETPRISEFFQSSPLLTTSGRSALYALLKSFDLPAGSRIGVPLFCCPVVFNAIWQTGHVPLFIDSNFHDFNLSPIDLRKKRSDIVALIAVHMFGNPCDMDSINSIAKGIPVIEDCAQSLYSSYKGRQTGFLASASFFSFRCGKYISSGEGSIVFCKETSLCEKVGKEIAAFKSWPLPSALRDYILTFIKATFYKRPLFGIMGYSFGKKLDKYLNLTAKDGFKTKRIAPGYLSLLEHRVPTYKKYIDLQILNARLLKSLITLRNVILPAENSECSSNWFQFALRFPSSAQRDAMVSHLWKHGIDSAPYLDTVVEEAREVYGYIPGTCPNAEQLTKTTLLIPIHYTLKEQEICSIANSINLFTE